jgi:uncharacterized protein
MAVSLVQKTVDYVAKILSTDGSGQDWYHTERVLATARQLQALEGGNIQLIELAALLHDIGDYKHYDYNETKGKLVLRATMDILEIDQEMQQSITRIIEESEYNGDDTKVPSTVEGRIIQDADWLDSLGALGIARVFANGGSMKRPIHDPKRKVRKRLTRDDLKLKKKEGTSVNYFYEKALKLPKMMNTSAARKIAEERAKFIEIFLEEFVLEWKGER